MSKVHDVDPKLIQRTQQWLAAQQQADGSWKPDAQFINEGATNRYNSDVLRITAYIAWSLENTGYQGPAVEKARQFIENHMSGKDRRLHAGGPGQLRRRLRKGPRVSLARRCKLLLDARTEKDEQAWWTSEETGVYATGAKRQRRDHRACRAGAAQVGRGLRPRRQGAQLYRLQEGCVRRLAHHPGHHHGAARRCCSRPKKARRTFAARSRSR